MLITELTGRLTLHTDHESSSIRHTDVNSVCFHREFGIKAGLPVRSWCLIQITKTGIKASDTMNKLRLTGFIRFAGLAVTVLVYVSTCKDGRWQHCTHART